LIKKDRFSTEEPDYVLIELPSLLNYSYPSKLVASADLTLFVCRANRVWSIADQTALDIYKKGTKQNPVVLLNGVEFKVIESVLGDLPKKRSWFRRVLKNAVRFQFKSNYQV
jgi:succinoglycan biosynthesis transport protein ExoP